MPSCKYFINVELIAMLVAFAPMLLAVPVRNRILGGKPCQVEKHPYMVAVLYRSHPICGGTLVSSTWVLTAAHCLIPDEPPVIYTILAGTSSLIPSNKMKKYSVRSYRRHPSYEPNSFVNDIALLELRFPLYPYDNIGYVKLPLADTNPKDVNCSVEVVGWGYTTEQGPISHQLMCANTDLITKDSCQRLYPNKLIHKQLCTLDQEGKDACKGDSGGPLLCNGTQYGIVSWGEGCGRYNKPGVFTDVAQFRSFIEETVAGKNNSNKISINFVIFIVLYSFLRYF